MSKVEEYSESRKAVNINMLKNMFNVAVEHNDIMLMAQAQKYGEGLIDAYEAYLDENQVDTIENIINDYYRQFIYGKGEDLN